MKVLVILPELEGVSVHVGGIGRRYASLIPALKAQGVDVVTLVCSASGLIDSGGDFGLVAVDLKRVPWPLRRWVVRQHVRRLWRLENFDCILATEWQGLAADAPRHAKVVTNLATSLELAELTTGERSRSLSAVSQRQVERNQIECSRATIAISAAMQNLCSSVYKLPRRTFVVRNSIDVTAAKREALAQVPAVRDSLEAPFVLFVGRVEKRKGVQTAISALNFLPPGVQLHIAGAAGDSRTEQSVPQLVSRLAPSVSHKVRYLGSLVPADLHAAMARAEVVICPSLWEGFGNAALEAMCSGTPLVATRGSGFDEFCRDEENSLLVEPDSPRDLAEAVTRIIDDPRLAFELRSAAYSAVDEFTPEAVARDFAEALQLAIAEGD